MADDVKITNLPDSGSQERVAYDLYKDLTYSMSSEETFTKTVRKHLAVYIACSKAVKRHAIELDGIT